MCFSRTKNPPRRVPFPRNRYLVVPYVKKGDFRRIAIRTNPVRAIIIIMANRIVHSSDTTTTTKCGPTHVSSSSFVRSFLCRSPRAIVRRSQSARLRPRLPAGRPTHSWLPRAYSEKTAKHDVTENRVRTRIVFADGRRRLLSATRSRAPTRPGAKETGR